MSVNTETRGQTGLNFAKTQRLSELNFVEPKQIP